MGDNITDLSDETGVPPVPPKTYQWEDIRRQKLEGRYPWTHLYKPPFDLETYEKIKDHEYEPVIPMDTNRKTPPPFVKITPEDDNKPRRETSEPPQDKHHLCLPSEDMDDEQENDYEDDDDDDIEEITAAELQNRLEEKYFRQSPGSSKHEYELTETRSVSPAITDDTSRESSSFQDKMHSQADKLKQKFKSLKDHISKDQVTSSPGIARKKDEQSKSRPFKKNKFNFRKHTAKSSGPSNFQLPQASRLSFSSLSSSFSRSRSSSVKSRERKRSQSSESDSQKRKIDFHFGTYPRIFSKKKKSENKSSEKPTTPKLKPKSAPSSPSMRRSPFPQRWISKFTENKKDAEKIKEEKKQQVKQQQKEKVIQESIFISLHEDRSPRPSSDHSAEPASTSEAPSSMPVDDKNFIFISLHEERFPEKLEKSQQRDEEAEIQSEIKKAETTRKFASLLRKLETDRKLRSRGKFADDKPEPVEIIEITNDDDGAESNIQENLENSVEIPDEPQDSDLPTESRVFTEEFRPQVTEEFMKYPSKPTTPKSTRPQVKEEIIKGPSRPTTPRSFRPETKEEIIKGPSRPNTPKSFRTMVKEEIIQTSSKPTTPKSIRSETVSAEKRDLRARVPSPSPPQDSSKDSSKFLKFKEMLKEAENMIKPSKSSNESKEKEFKEKESKDHESKKFQEFKENLLKETEKIGTLKNKIKNYFAKEGDKNKSDFDDKHIYEEFDNVEDTPPREIVKRVAINESQNQEINPAVPQKIPRKKLKKLDSDKESKESLSAFDDPAFNDIVDFDEQKPMTKTYISESLQEVNEIPVEPKFSPNPKHFKNYEKALEKTKSYSSIEIENNLYSATNTLAQLETPVPPSRPSRTRSLQRANKRTKPIYEENKENTNTADQSQNYNTFPMVRPDKPRRKFRKPRTYSNSTNSEVKSMNEFEDAAISQNIANSKQLSVSFLPLMSNAVGEPITNYTLRETSSMIHLNTTIRCDPPMAPKRRRSSVKDGTSKYNTLPNKKYCASSKTSLAESETCNGIHAEGDDFEFADEANSAADSPPRRPQRKRLSGPSYIDDDRTSREIESLPSERSLCDSDSKDINGYSVIKSVKKSHSQPTTSAPESNTTPRRKSRRLSDFFTLPRIHTPTNYVSPPCTLPYERRLPSPSRPPRKSKPYTEPVYTNEENINVMTDFGDEEELNFNLATVDDDIPDPDNNDEKDEKNLQTDEVMERMKIRPLPPPPRPIRKPKDDKSDTLSCDYSQVKKNTDNKTNNLNLDFNELKIINTNAEADKHPDESTAEQLERSSAVIKTTNRFEDLALTSSPSSSSTLNVITAQRLNVSELNVAKLSISEIESSKLTTSNVDTVTMQATDFKSERGHLVLNSVELASPSIAERLSPILQDPRPILDNLESASRDVTPSSDEVPVQDIRERSRISSMIPEVGSDEESTSTAPKIVKPSRRKPIRKEKEESSRSTTTIAEASTSQPTLAELMCQILQICHSSVGQAIHSLLEQVIPEDREKRNEVQAAIWVITIIIAGCLMLGLQSNEKIVHHHHWDFHFPPPH
ncbi:uncharacterized protein LOC135843264 isoform X2 [Planococcus citri]|uniref:uncharacterized protein LOC135843264 isoform X2 n=1 Tax=Planococcus citri TaxID=170843 RepID=UPI0031F73B63